MTVQQKFGWHEALASVDRGQMRTLGAGSCSLGVREVY
jgi:hypothetical protein